MLYSNNIFPLITKPTRLTDHTSTLIDHIYTNTPIDLTTPGIATVDISDHLPIFCIIENRIKKQTTKRYYRNYSKFDANNYLHDIRSTNWNSVLSTTNNLHDKTAKFVDSLKGLVDKHAPIKQIPRSKLKQKIHKPWITNGLLKSIKVKQKMYRSHFLSNDPFKRDSYKKFTNILNKLKQQCKTTHYKQQFDFYKNNLKKTWTLISSLVNRKTKSQTTISRLVHNNTIYTDKHDIANRFNEYFVNVGSNLASPAVVFRVSHAFPPH